MSLPEWYHLYRKRFVHCREPEAPREKLQQVAGRFARMDTLGDEYSEAALSAVLKTQIINYAKTCDVYVSHRKAGYSKDFLAEHEAEILLHKAANKKADSIRLLILSAPISQPSFFQ